MWVASVVYPTPPLGLAMASTGMRVLFMPSME